MKISKKKLIITILIILFILLVAFISIGIFVVNTDSYKMSVYLNQNFNGYVEIKDKGYSIVKKENKYGIIDCNKNEILPIVYDSIDLIKYSNSYLISVKSAENYVLLNDKLEEIVSSNKEILVYNDNGYAQTWNEEKFELVSIENKNVFAKGIVNLNDNSIEYVFNTNSKLIYKDKKDEADNIEDEEKTESIISNFCNSNNELLYENNNITIFNHEFLLLKDSEQGYMLVDFNGEKVTAYYSNFIRYKNGEIYLVNENDENVMKLKITKKEQGYDVIKQQIKR